MTYNKTYAVSALVHLAGDLAEEHESALVLLRAKRAYAGETWRTGEERRMTRYQMEEGVMQLPNRTALMHAAYQYIHERGIYGAQVAETLLSDDAPPTNDQNLRVIAALEQVYKILWPQHPEVEFNITTFMEEEDAA
ncbi:hypothetical protein [Nesterenkonia suensis]